MTEIRLQVVFQIWFCIPVLYWTENNILAWVDLIQSGINLLHEGTEKVHFCQGTTSLPHPSTKKTNNKFINKYIIFYRSVIYCPPWPLSLTPSSHTTHTHSFQQSPSSLCPHYIYHPPPPPGSSSEETPTTITSTLLNLLIPPPPCPSIYPHPTK